MKIVKILRVVIVVLVEIIDDIMDGSMDTLIKNILDNNISYTVKEENQIFQISTISKQKDMTDNSMTIVDLGEWKIY